MKYNNTNPPTDKEFIEWLEKENWIKHTQGPLTLWVNQVKVVPATSIFNLYDIWYKGIKDID